MTAGGPQGTRQTLVRGVSVTLAANLFAVGCMALLVLGLPALVSQATYGYWSLYQFYALYLGYITFGVTDGVYLRYGGRTFADLPHGRFVSQFWVLVVSSVVANALVLLVLLTAGAEDVDRRAVIVAVCVGNAAFVARTFVTMTMQATHRLREYALLTAAERLLIVLGTGLALLSGARDVETLVWIDACAKALVLVVAVAWARSITVGRPAGLAETRDEVTANVVVGIQVVLANLAMIAVYGVLRLFVERMTPIEVFGQVSLALSLANFLMVVVNSLAIALFPTLKRLAPSRYAEAFTLVRTGLVLPVTVGLITYFPVAWVVGRYLPDYDVALRYLTLLYPIAMFDGKMRLLAGSFLKAMRRETLLMTINLVATTAGVAVFAVTMLWLKDLDLTMLSLVALLVVRSLVAEHAVGRSLGIATLTEAGWEVGMAALFVVLVWWLPTGAAAATFTVCLVIYLVLRRFAVLALWRGWRAQA